MGGACVERRGDAGRGLEKVGGACAERRGGAWFGVVDSFIVRASGGRETLAGCLV